jgi:fatty-acyl-CoA synthase
VRSNAGDNSANVRKAWLRALEMTALVGRNPCRTFPILIENLSDRFGDTLALLSEHECLTYRALAERSNRYARWALGRGLSAGDVVCLYMPNCANYMAIWLGITRIGGTVALVNTNLTDQSLVHSINSVSPRLVIAGAEVAYALAAVLPRLAPGVQCWAYGHGNHSFARIDLEIQGCTGDPLDFAERQPPSIMDPALYIYTSGTTGLPKAAKVSHLRLMQWSHWFAGMMDTRASDRMYNCLPMYHSIGGVVAIGATLVNGGSVVLRQRFSASQFWDDVVETNCTLFQYIGELCRYLVKSPPHAREADHRVRLCCGNGLRADIWDEFKRRFRVPQILEFYAATEGNFSLYNCEGKPGAVGRIPSFLSHRFPVALVKFDNKIGGLLRNDQGFCIRCSTNEVGEAIGKISDDHSTPGSPFEGYSDEVASARKVLRNVFVHGDAWYSTGDLMRRDERGYYYFVDRIGDTFRWKGENVSTAEVAETICRCRGVVEAVVYGVAVPGTEGRAGMAAIVISDEFRLVAFRTELASRLPEYARPLFLRIRGEIEMTSTFKPKKGDLSREGYDPAATRDDVYFDDRVNQAFVKVNAILYDGIVNRNVRV